MTSYKKYIQPYLDIIKSEECFVEKKVNEKIIQEKIQITVCEEQKLLAEYVEYIFATEKLHFNEEQTEKYFSYQKYFPYKLFPWEAFCFALHNCVYQSDGSLRWPELVIYVGRGSGKNGFLAFEDFCLLTPANGIKNYDIDICATSEEQAKRTFDDIYEVLETHKYNVAIVKNFKWTQTYIKNKITNSVLKYRTNNAKTKDGLRSGKVDLDEEHAYENWDNIEVFTGALGKKEQPRLTHLSSNGNVRGGPFDITLDRCQRILRREIPDNGTLPFVCKLNNKELVDDPKNWYMANPSLQYMPHLLKEYHREYNNFIENVDVGGQFMSKRMNCPTELKETKVASKEDIMACCNALPSLRGKHCVVGIDFTKTSDFMSVVLLFKEKKRYYAIHHSWFCSNSLDKRRIKFPLKKAEADGYLTIIDDVEIKREIISDYLLKMMSLYHIDAIAIDSYRYSLLSDELKKIGFDFNLDKERTKLTRPQSDIAKVVPMINSIFLSKLLTFGDDMLMRWFINNTKLVPQKNNNFIYGKIEPKSRKNDGFMAFVAAMCIEERIVEEYEIEDLDPVIW